jgi:ribosomal protein S18 acetylase RimI-like enzyme
MIMRPAAPDDIEVILRLRCDASRWLADRGIDQWARPWPDAVRMRQHILTAIQVGEPWMAERGGTICGTITLNDHVHPGLWTASELRQPACYVHRLIVDRALSGRGLGAEILDWAADMASSQGAAWLRLDVWTNNAPLHRYYRSQGFTHVRTVRGSDYPSGAIFQRRLVPVVHGAAESPALVIPVV